MDFTAKQIPPATTWGFSSAMSSSTTILPAQTTFTCIMSRKNAAVPRYQIIFLGQHVTKRRPSLPIRPDRATADRPGQRQHGGRRQHLNPLEIADAILFLASSMADFLTGESLHVNGGKTAF
jgi:NAD(P)-dependent dehydrogenase (short-subunit alcohol dehydrogenase family)